MEMCDGDQLLQTAWLTGWELEIYKATPWGFHPLSLSGAAHSSCVDRRQSNQESLLPPEPLRSTKKGPHVLSEAKFSHPISPDGMNFTSHNQLCWQSWPIHFSPAEQFSPTEMQIQQNIIFVDICNRKLLKHFISSLAFGWFCLICCEVVKTQQRSPWLLNHSPKFPFKKPVLRFLRWNMMGGCLLAKTLTILLSV